MNRFEELKEKLENQKILLNEYEVGDTKQLTAIENRKNKGSVAFVLPDGKIGFPSRNSIPTNIGDIIRGVIEVITDNYVFVTVTEIVYSAESRNETN